MWNVHLFSQEAVNSLVWNMFNCWIMCKANKSTRTIQYKVKRYLSVCTSSVDKCYTKLKHPHYDQTSRNLTVPRRSWYEAIRQHKWSLMNIKTCHRSANYDRPGECSAEKDCLWLHWRFDHLSRSHLQSHLNSAQVVETSVNIITMSSQTVLTKSFTLSDSCRKVTQNELTQDC